MWHARPYDDRLEGSTVLRYILAHHFPGLLQAFLGAPRHLGLTASDAHGTQRRHTHPVSATAAPATAVSATAHAP
eukprot:6291580-Prymnesium_polylepis.1